MNLFKRKKEIKSVANGKIISISRVNDEVFSSGVLGIGYGIIPSDGNIVSPVTGTVKSIHSSHHAYMINTEDSLEIMVHIGINTVELGGKGITPSVTVGEKIEAGQSLANINIDLIQEKGYDTCTVVLITNPEKIKHYEITEGSAKKGDSAMTYTK